jgi:hypothetical protein
MVAVTELAFVMSRRQNHFFSELVEAVRHELDAIGVLSTLSTKGFPSPREDLVYILVPPHEYYHVEGGENWPQPDVLARTIFLCAEQPGTTHFDGNVNLAGSASTVFDINRTAVREFGRRGIAAGHFQLGHSEFWDRFSSNEERDVDVLFLGSDSERRARHLASFAPVFWKWKQCLTISDNSRPNWRSSEGFYTGIEKWRLLGRSKVLINLHQGTAPYFEWLRIVEAICNGCVVVSEHSVDYGPLRPGEHFVSGHPENLGLLVQGLLEDNPRRWELKRDACLFLRSEVPLRDAVLDLVAAAEEAERAPLPAVWRSGAQRTVAPGEEDWNRQFQPPASTRNPDMSMTRQALKELMLDSREMKRELDCLRLTAERGESPPLVEIDRRSTAYEAANPRVSVLVSLYNFGNSIGVALDSVAASRYRDVEIVIVDDGSKDESADRVREWIAEHESVSAVLVRHPVNRGLPYARNAAIEFARGELCFILDADNEVYPNCLSLLAEALDRDPGAAFAYGMLAKFGPDGPLGLTSNFPWEPERFRAGNYIDAMALFRTRVLREVGGYVTDRRLYGWEDYDLWCSLAEAGFRGVLVPQIVARYQVARHSMLSVTNLSTTLAFSLLAQRHPTLFAGVELPL